MKAESFVRVPWITEKRLPGAGLLAWTGPLVTGVYVATVALLIYRRLAGALVEPLGLGAFLATTAALLLLAGWSMTVWPAALWSLAAASRVGRGATAGLPRSARRDAALRDVLGAAPSADSSTRLNWFRLKSLADGGTLLAWMPALAMLTLALVGIVALAVPGTSALALVVAAVAWLLTAIGVLARERFARRSAPEVVRERAPRRERNLLANESLLKVRPESRQRTSPSKDSLKSTANDDPSVIQQLVRRQDSATGEQRIDGWLRCDFSTGQRTAALHVAFCPPLSALPIVEVQLDPKCGAVATCKVAELYAHGARFDVRLASPAKQSTTARVVFSAVMSRSASVNADAANINDAADVAADS